MECKQHDLHHTFPNKIKAAIIDEPQMAEKVIFTKEKITISEKLGMIQQKLGFIFTDASVKIGLI